MLLKQHRRPSVVASLHWDFLNAQAALAKTSTRSKTEQIHFDTI